MSMLLFDIFDRSRTRDTLAGRGSRPDTHYHIVTTFEAKESGALGVLTQSLGILGWLECGCRRCVSSKRYFLDLIPG
jgi:hypothetical protein